jgi:hypothetical protein
LGPRTPPFESRTGPYSGDTLPGESAKPLGVVRLLREEPADAILCDRIERVLSHGSGGHRGEKLQAKGLGIISHAVLYTGPAFRKSP